MTDFRRIGRNNKNRGRAFERHVADFLGWTRVPYSGAQKDWGGGDVVDGFYTKDGLWTAECKTQIERSSGDILIKAKWLKQMFDAATGSERRSILIVKTVGAALENSIVLMDESIFDWFRNIVEPPDGARRIFGLGRGQSTRGKGHNFVIPKLEQSLAIPDHPVHMPVTDRTSHEQINWFFYRLDAFKAYIDAARLYKPAQ